MVRSLKKRKKGLSLIEVLIASSVTLVLMGTVTSFLWSFSGFSKENIMKNNATTALLNYHHRIEKEILSARSVLSSYTLPGHTLPLYSDHDTLILSLPVYENDGLKPVSTDPHDTSANDVMIIEFQAASGNIGKMLISQIPQTAYPTSRKKFIRNTLVSDISTLDQGGKPYDIFKYYVKRDSSEPLSAVRNNTDNLTVGINSATAVHVLTYVKQVYGKNDYWGKNENTYRLRNFTTTEVNDD